jgi:hypothetical protein
MSRKNCLQIGGYGGGRGESMRLLLMDLNGKLEVSWEMVKRNGDQREIF